MDTDMTSTNDTPEVDATPQDITATTPAPPEDTTPAEPVEVDKMFPAEYVRELRAEAAERRTRALDAEAARVDAEARADDYAAELWAARVALDGRLADPAALPYTPGDSLDPADIAERIGAAIEANPRLSARAVSGDIGQGRRSPAGVNLIDIMRGF